MFWHSFNLKPTPVICKKVLGFISLDNYFTDLFTEVQIWYWNPFKLDRGHCFINIQWTPAKIWQFLRIKAVNKDKMQNKLF